MGGPRLLMNCVQGETSTKRTGKPLLCLGSSDLTRQTCGLLLAAGWDAHHAGDVQAAEALLAAREFNVGLLVQTGLDAAQFAALDAFLGRHVALEWVGLFDPALVVQASWRDLIVSHLFDHHTLPIDLPRVTDCLGHALGRARLREQIIGDDLPVGDVQVVGTSPAMVELMRKVRRVAAADAPVLICGESGTGKDLIAQALHRYSRRAAAPFVAINCGAIPSSLIQSELFGHETGAFTGATEARCGNFERASGGTLFLDEIADLPLDLQVNLLRFLQEGTISRVGSNRVLRLVVRVIAATHADLDEAVAGGRFRHDLFYRLNVLPLRLPPLRERRDDIPLLAQHFFRQFAAERNPKLKGFSQQAVCALQDHGWPGNVRELINRVRCSMIMAQGRLIGPGDLGLDTASIGAVASGLDDVRLRAERKAIDSCLEQTGRKVAVAARRLGISRMTLYRLMAKHSMTAAPESAAEARVADKVAVPAAP